MVKYISANLIHMELASEALWGKDCKLNPHIILQDKIYIKLQTLLIRNSLLLNQEQGLGGIHITPTPPWTS